MRLIRKGTFETNSSSTHAVVIPKKVNDEEYSLYDSLDHDYSFGRQECRLCDNWDEKLAYAYIILKENYDWSQNDNGWKPNHITTQEDIDNFKKKIMAMWNVIETIEKPRYKTEPTPQDLFNYIDNDENDEDLDSVTVTVLKGRWNNFVDHANGLDSTDFIDRLKNDDEFVKRFIFNKQSYITIGGDEYRGYNIKTIGFEYDYDEHYWVNEKGEKPPREWFNKDGRIKDKYWDRYSEEYNIEAGGFWNKLKEYEKDNDVYLKGN